MLKKVLPKKDINFEVESNPSRYIQSTLLITRKVRKQLGGVCFLPTRRSNIPSHYKLDTEALAQIFLPYSERVKERKSVGENRRAYNDLAWNRVLDREKVDGKLKRSGYRYRPVGTSQNFRHLPTHFWGKNNDDLYEIAPAFVAHRSQGFLIILQNACLTYINVFGLVS